MVTTDSEVVERCLSRALLHDAVGTLFGPPVGEAFTSLLEPESLSALALTAASVSAEVRDEVLNLLSVDRRAQGVREAHRRLFGHTVRGGVTPYETEYGVEGLFLQPQELSDLSGFAAAFGLRLAPGTRERIDHICCQFEFMGFLCAKEAYARSVSNADMAEVTRRAQRLFLRDHLGRFAPSFARRVAEGSTGYYRALAGLCRVFVTAECAAMGVSVGSRALPVRTHRPVDVEAPCGVVEEPAPMEIEEATA